VGFVVDQFEQELWPGHGGWEPVQRKKSSFFVLLWFLLLSFIWGLIHHVGSVAMGVGDGDGRENGRK
jgi:hypothetical protein